MWILNQKQNRLLEVKDIWKNNLREGRPSIEAITFRGTEVRLGTYDSEEKVDEILKRIISAMKKGIEVYEMPNEEEEREKITPKQLENEFRNICRAYGGCTLCKYEKDYLDLDTCKWGYLLENYYVTRK